jgi:hypothetical protein
MPMIREARHNGIDSSMTKLAMVLSPNPQADRVQTRDEQGGQSTDIHD